MLNNNIKVGNLWDCTTVRPKMRCMNYFFQIRSLLLPILHYFFSPFFKKKKLLEQAHMLLITHVPRFRMSGAFYSRFLNTPSQCGKTC